MFESSRGVSTAFRGYFLSPCLDRAFPTIARDLRGTPSRQGQARDPREAISASRVHALLARSAIAPTNPTTTGSTVSLVVP